MRGVQEDHLVGVVGIFARPPHLVQSVVVVVQVGGIDEGQFRLHMAWCEAVNLSSFLSFARDEIDFTSSGSRNSFCSL